MSPAALPPVVAPPVETPHGFTCTEIWGGNRPIDREIRLPGIRGRIFSRPCIGGRGGDIHYVSLCGSGLISRFCLADVAGHGESVGAVSDAIHSLLRKYMNSPNQGQVLSQLNRHLVASGRVPMTTAVAVTYIYPYRRISISYAGHPHAWLYRHAERRWLPLDGATDRRPPSRPMDLPLAIEPTVGFSRRSERVHRGDRLLLLTDGVLEIPSRTGELYGTERLSAFLESHSRTTLDALLQALLDDLRVYCRPPVFEHDDVSVVLLEFDSGPGGLGLAFAVRNRLQRALRTLWPSPRPANGA